MIEAAFHGTRGGFCLGAEFMAPSRGVTALFGPSGCGKTSVLRCVAGLLRLPKGRLKVDGETWQEGRRFRPVHRRALGYVFQEPSLFPHLTVAGNLRYGARRAKTGGVGFDEVVDLLGISRLFDRPVAQLSGGERQRIAIGRALLSQPRLLLMDEPLSALDRISKEEILPYLERLHGALEIPVIYVSHDIEEVERLADTLVLMEGGRVRACGPAAELLTDPALPPARGAHPASVVEGEVARVDAEYGLSVVRTRGARLLVPGDLGPVGARARVRIPAADVSLGRQSPIDTTILNACPARILSAAPAGAERMSVRLALGEEGEGAAILSHVSRLSWDRLALTEGERVVARIKAVALTGG